MSEPIMIGVDHGYAAMKTTHCTFPTGLVEYEHEPYTRKGVLEYGGKFYVVGSGRQPLQKDKTQTEDYYLLTLAAIAMEMGFRGTNGMADIHLAAGLPLTSFGRDKKAFRDYLLRAGGPVTFRYEGESYTITVSDVSLFPQGYAAVLTQPELLDEPSVIVADIGGWTVDLMRLDRRIPNAATCRSLELGMIRCVDEIGEQVRRLFGLSLTAPQIESVLRGDSASMDERVRAVIHAQADKYVRGLLSAITESGLDVRAMPTVFLGGGAALMKRHGGAVEGLFRPFTFERVQKLKERRTRKRQLDKQDSPLRGKMACGVCGTALMRRTTGKGLISWVCRKHDESAADCPVGRIPETEIYAAFMRMYNKIRANADIVLKPALTQLDDLERALQRENPAMLEINQAIAQVAEQSHNITGRDPVGGSHTPNGRMG